MFLELEGIIKNDASVETFDGKIFYLPVRGTDKDNYPKVLIDATSVGGYGTFKSQSIRPYIGMKVIFLSYNGVNGFNFIIKNE